MPSTVVSMTADAMVCARCGQRHERCHGHNKTGAPCGRWPNSGSALCVKHFGNAPQVLAKARRRLAAVWAEGELTRLGVAIPVADGEALAALRDEAAGNVVALRRMVHTLGLDPDGPGPMAYEPLFHQTGRPTGEAKAHIVWVMYCDERDRLAKLDEVCVKLGLEQRRVRLEEAEAALFAQAVNVMLAAVVPTELHGRAWDVLSAELRRLDRGDDG